MFYAILFSPWWLFQQRIDYGVMSSCLVKPALYIVQRTGPRVRLDRLDQDTEEDEEEDDTGELGCRIYILSLLDE